MGKKFLLLILFLSAFQLNNYAQGDLLVAPLRIVFEGDKQKDEVGLTNIGKDTAFYAISFTQNDMLEDGSFQPLSDTTQGKLFSSPYIRVFPRKVILAPGESQTIRLQLRKRQDMEIGEYRSHLHFRSDNEKKNARGEKSNEKLQGIGVQLRAIYGISIPVIVRNGNTKATTNFSNVVFKRQNDSVAVIFATINRIGNQSTYGDVIAEFVNNKLDTKKIGSIRGMGIYTSTNKRHISMPVRITPDMDLKTGRIKLKYITTKDSDSKTMTEHTFTIK